MRDTRYEIGSALILTVVLTSLLAIVGVMFVMVTRVDKIATSAISENRELNFAVESVVALVSQELVLDVPGMPKGQEYYDYPGQKDKWLASLEPYNNGSYKWRQISDVTGYMHRKWGATAQQNADTKIIKDHEEIELDNDGDLEEQLADADGDGVADSKWIELDDITSSKGKSIYAAIRIVDNGGTVNVNTAYKFDPNDVNVTAAEIDGSSQLQIDLEELARGSDTIDYIDDARNPLSRPLSDYQDEVIWRIEDPCMDYLPFDISDELTIRGRYIIKQRDTITRLKRVWEYAFDKSVGYAKETPYTATSDLPAWFNKGYRHLSDESMQQYYNMPHISTTYNMDRIIEPSSNGNVYKMININRVTDAGYLYNALMNSVDSGMDIEDDDRRRFAQLAANIVDFIDGDASVTTFEPNDTYYGFDAQPFITEIAVKIDTYPATGRNYYAVELYNPFDRTINLNDFELVIADNNDPYNVYHTIGFDEDDKIDANDCFVIASNLSEFNIYNDPEDRKQDSKLTFFIGWREIDKSKPVVDIRRRPDKSKPPVYIGWINSYDLFLKRKVRDVNDIERWIYVDKQVIDPVWAPAGRERYYGRDVHDWHIVYQTLARDKSGHGSLGIRNNADSYEEFTKHNFSFFLPNPLRPAEKFITVGDIPRILTVGPDTSPHNTIGEQLQRTAENEEDEIRLDLQNPYHRNAFQYLTVFDPSRDFDSIGSPIDNDGDGLLNESDPNKPEETPEFKVPGRININAAPWYVIAQLPWMEPKIAQAIVAYRDKLETPVDYRGDTGRWDRITENTLNDSFELDFDQEDIREEAGFASIGELNFCLGGDDDEYSIQRYALDNRDLEGFPDLTTDGSNQGDGLRDDFEERDIIFSRISNLVTVRSDVFTAYILVRIGADGPQKRVIAVLDRSDVYSSDGKVRIVALHFVPDPR